MVNDFIFKDPDTIWKPKKMNILLSTFKLMNKIFNINNKGRNRVVEKVLLYRE